MKTLLLTLLPAAVLTACSAAPLDTTEPPPPPTPTPTAASAAWSLLGDTPGPRAGAAAVYDAVRDRMLVFGGSANDLWAQSFSGPNANQWQRIEAGGDGPPPIGAVAVIDEGADQLMILPNDSLERAWTLPLGGGGAWSLAGFDAAPQIELGFSVAVDATGRRLFAYTSGTPEVWELPLDGGTTWQRVAGSPGWEGFSCHDDLVFDGANGRLLVQSGGWPRGDVYALSLDATPTWTQLNQAEAWFDYGATSTYDAAGGRFLITGPDPGAWIWSYVVADPAGQWTHLPVAGTAPGVRTGASGVYDSTRGRFVLFGGSSTNPDETTAWNDDTWAISLGDAPAWSQVGELAATLQMLGGTSLAFAPETGETVRVGGQTYGTPAPSLVFDPTTVGWRSLGDTPAAALSGGTGAWDPLGRRVVMFGGYTTTMQDQTWALDLDDASWSEIDGAGARPSARTGHSMVDDPTGGRMLMFGGSSPGGYVDDTWALGMSGGAWTSLAIPGAAPAPRANHAAAFDDAGRRMLVHGGTDESGNRGDAWMLELAPAPHWVALPAAHGPPPASGHFAAFDPGTGRFLVVENPASTSSVTADGVTIWALSTDGAPSWSHYCPKGTRPATADGAVWANGNLFVTSQGSAWRFDASSTPTCD